VSQYWPFVVLVVPTLIAVLKRLGPAAWAWVPTRWQWLPAALLVAGAAAVPALQAGAPPLDVGVAALEAFLAAVGVVHVGKRLWPSAKS
jgi:hypothetical protein